jgi:hypothetical protein
VQQVFATKRDSQNSPAENLATSNNDGLEYEVDNKVSVLTMAPDKLIGEVRRVPAIIIASTGTRYIFYDWDFF